jgi:hypothetical protein
VLDLEAMVKDDSETILQLKAELRDTQASLDRECAPEPGPEHFKP